MLRAQLQRVVDWVFGYDFFISYAHDRGLEYVADLRKRLLALEEQFRVFLDRDIYHPGTDLKRATRRRVRMSTHLVVIAVPRTMHSTWVRREVEVALEASREVIVIDLGRSFEDSPRDNPLRAILEDHLRICESAPVDSGEVSDAVISELRKSFRGVRQETLRLRVASALVLVFAALFGFASWQWSRASQARALAEVRLAHAESRRLAISSRLARDRDPMRALLLARDAVETASTAE